MTNLEKPGTLGILSAMAVVIVLTFVLGSGRGQPVAKKGDAPQTGPAQDAPQMIKK